MKTEPMEPNNISVQPDEPALVKRNPESCRKGDHDRNHRIPNAEHELRTNPVSFFAEILNRQEEIKQYQQKRNQCED
ncbi:hypothetical protein D3C84_1213330 [compost metagenome]